MHVFSILTILLEGDRPIAKEYIKEERGRKTRCSYKAETRIRSPLNLSNFNQTENLVNRQTVQIWFGLLFVHFQVCTLLPFVVIPFAKSTQNPNIDKSSRTLLMMDVLKKDITLVFQRDTIVTGVKPLLSG